MSLIKIEHTFDESDCEDCGSSWSNGFNVTIDGEPFGDYPAIAHCYNGSNHELENVLKDIINHLGHEIIISH